MYSYARRHKIVHRENSFQGNLTAHILSVNSNNIFFSFEWRYGFFGWQMFIWQLSNCLQSFWLCRVMSISVSASFQFQFLSISRFANFPAHKYHVRQFPCPPISNCINFPVHKFHHCINSWTTAVFFWGPKSQVASNFHLM